MKTKQMNMEVNRTIYGPVSARGTVEGERVGQPPSKDIACKHSCLCPVRDKKDGPLYEREKGNKRTRARSGNNTQKSGSNTFMQVFDPPSGTNLFLPVVG